MGKAPKRLSTDNSMLAGRFNRWPEWVENSRHVNFEIAFSVVGFGHSGLKSESHMPWHFDTEQEWAAHVFGVTPEQYLDWRDWHDSHCSCRAYTKKGTLCENQVHSYARPHEFDPDVTPYCDRHKDPASRGVPKVAKLAKPKKASGKRGGGYVYLMYAEGTPRHKIGLSKSPQKRNEVIDGQSPYPVKIIDCYAVNDMTEAEGYWHCRFHVERVHGEWFEITPKQVQEFVNVAQEVAA